MAGVRPPEFGPNGAVINAPAMTDDMRGRITDRARRDGGWRTVVINMTVVTALGGSLLVREREPLASIMLAAVGACLAVGWAVWRLLQRKAPKSS